MPDEPSESDGSVDPDEKPDEVPDLKKGFNHSVNMELKFSGCKSRSYYDL